MAQSDAAGSSSQATPLQIHDIKVIDNTKLKKAITAAALGNAMEWFDFGVYGFVAYALGRILPQCRPGHSDNCSACHILRAVSGAPSGWLVFRRNGRPFRTTKVLSLTIIIMAASTFCIGLIPPMPLSESGRLSFCCFASWHRAFL